MGVVSKFRYVETIPGGIHGTFFNVRNVNTRLPPESNGFCVSSKYAAIPLAHPTGVVTIIDVSVLRLVDAFFICGSHARPNFKAFAVAKIN